MNIFLLFRLLTTNCLLQETNISSSRPSYAQIAQKTKAKTITPPKPTVDVVPSKDSRVSANKNEATDSKPANKATKNNKNNAEPKIEKERSKDESENIDPNGTSPKPQRPMRESRIQSDPGTRNAKIVNTGARNNSYNGPATSSAKESYASKSSASLNSGAKSPTTKRTPIQSAQSDIKPTNPKNNTKGPANMPKSQKQTHESLASEEKIVNAEEAVQVEETEEEASAVEN